jgi:UDP-N-acetylglucosamine 2-epimerase (non-hydrolysing)
LKREFESAQHREMLDQVLDFVDIKPYYDLDVMKPNQNLYSLTADIITEIKMIFEDYLPYFAYARRYHSCN